MKPKIKRRGISAFFRSFILTAVVACCGLGLLIGIYFADSGIRSDLGEEAMTVFSSKPVKGGYEVELLGMRATLGGEWTYQAWDAFEKVSVLLPPEVRVVLEMLLPGGAQ